MLTKLDELGIQLEQKTHRHVLSTDQRPRNETWPDGRQTLPGRSRRIPTWERRLAAFLSSFGWPGQKIQQASA